MTMLTFDQALGLSAGAAHRHVLLGNGFSRACRNDIFAYDALFERADFARLSGNARAVFEALGTTDFEVVINALKNAARIASVYAAENPALARSLDADANALRDVLVSAIAGSHPDRLTEISNESYSACKCFLANFERTFTLNYDLLLYWAVMQRELLPAVDSNDGFRTPEYGEAEYVTWEIEQAYGQTIYYLHGALHLFDAGSELQKYTWAHTGVRLTEQIRNALDLGKFPMFVAEGTSDEKLDRIKHHAYLTKAFESFSRITGALFIFGHSLAENDEHFLRLIEKSGLSQLYVGIFGDPSTPANMRVITRAEAMVQNRLDLAARRRRRSPDLTVHFYDAESARPWG